MRSPWIFIAAVAVVAGCNNAPEATPAKPEASTTGTTPAPPKPTPVSGGKLGKLEMEDVKEGKGPAAGVGDTLFMTYTGTLADGTVFDSNDKPGAAPFSFVLGAGSVIKGWDQGLVGIKLGGERKLSIPSELGYGKAGAGEKIPGDTDLFFTVKLLDLIKKGDETTVYKEDLKLGSGREVKKGDTVSILYTGTLSNGKKFDSTADRQNKPFEFKVGDGQVIPGFDLAVSGMKAGGERNVIIPPQMGYGMESKGPDLPANSVLHFNLKLLSIK